MAKPNLKFTKLNETVRTPEFATKGSACFDLYTNFHGHSTIKLYLDPRDGQARSLRVDDKNTSYILIYPNERMLIPTGLVFDIPEGHSVRLHIRSSVALKRGIVLANSEGIIDSDYVDPLYVLLLNLSNVAQRVEHDIRICQAELVKSLNYSLAESEEAPSQKTDRDGGMGSTG